MTEKILIDTDPGIDDAFAILYALKSPDFDVLGLTTVYGNASIEQTTHNARALVDMGGKPCHRLFCVGRLRHDLQYGGIF